MISILQSRIFSHGMSKINVSLKTGLRVPKWTAVFLFTVLLFPKNCHIFTYGSVTKKASFHNKALVICIKSENATKAALELSLISKVTYMYIYWMFGQIIQVLENVKKSLNCSQMRKVMPKLPELPNFIKGDHSNSLYIVKRIWYILIDYTDLTE